MCDHECKPRDLDQLRAKLEKASLASRRGAPGVVTEALDECLQLLRNMDVHRDCYPYEYDVVHGLELVDIVPAVNAWLANHPGWETAGGLCFGNGGYRQAVRRRQAGKPYLLPDRNAPIAR